MKRREFSLATLGSAAAAVGALGAVGAVGTLGLQSPALAQGPAKFVAGKDYIKLDRAIPTETETGKTEVIEFISI